MCRTSNRSRLFTGGWSKCNRLNLVQEGKASAAGVICLIYIYLIYNVAAINVYRNNKRSSIGPKVSAGK